MDIGATLDSDRTADIIDRIYPSALVGLLMALLAVDPMQRPVGDPPSDNC